MNERVKKAFEECNKFIDEHTPEELREYEKSLALDYNNYFREYSEEELETFLHIFDALSDETGTDVWELLTGRKLNEKENIAHEEMLNKLSTEIGSNVLDLFEDN